MHAHTRSIPRKLYLPSLGVCLLLVLAGCASRAGSETVPPSALTAAHTPTAVIAQAATPPTATATSNDSPTSPLQSEPTATPTITPPTPLPTPAPVPTSSIVPGWLTYENDFLGYSFSYPPEARIRTQGVTGFPEDELPEGKTAEEYLAQLEARYPDNLCVSVSYKTTFITFVPWEDLVGKYTAPCGVTGVGDFKVETDIESLIIGNVQMVGDVFRLYGRDSGAWHGEFTMLKPHDNEGIHFGAFSGTEGEYIEARETMMQIVLSFRQE